MKGLGIYKVEYYGTHPRGGWSVTLHDRVLAKSDKEALEKFHEKHPEIRVATVVNWELADY